MAIFTKYSSYSNKLPISPLGWNFNMLYTYNPADKENRNSLLWLGLVCAVIVWEAIEAPLTFVLEKGIQEHHLWWDGLFSLILLTDVYLRLKNKLNLPDKMKEEDRIYHRSPWLAFDIATSIPFAIVAASLTKIFGIEVSPELIAILRLSRVARIVRLRFVFDLLDFIPKLI